MEESGSTEVSDTVMKEFIEKMPKVELHAHLNGSLSKSTVTKLLNLSKEKTNDQDKLKVCCSSSSSLAECFEIFHVIHQITDSPEAVYIATCDVIEEFYNDGVRHLELRSTPREVIGSMTRPSYVESMLSAVKKCKQRFPQISVKLILAIDRRNSISVAEETVKIAEKNLSVITGIDLSGDPLAGDISSFIPVLKYAKKVGLKLALHMAETPNTNEEVSQLLQLEPDRIGHGTHLHPAMGGSETNFSLLQKLQTPLEICLTSNVISDTVPSYREHHFGLWRQIAHPCSICTDDKGVFNTSLSEEYFLAKKHFSLTAEDLWQLSYDSISYSFISEPEKEALQKMWLKHKTALFQIIQIEFEQSTPTPSEVSV